VIKRVVSGFNGKLDRETIVIAPTFADFPNAIVAYAKNQGYDNKNKNHKISGITHNGKIYFVQENIDSELAIEKYIA